MTLKMVLAGKADNRSGISGKYKRIKAWWVTMFRCMGLIHSVVEVVALS
jgi:hypothetical protein